MNHKILFLIILPILGFYYVFYSVTITHFLKSQQKEINTVCDPIHIGIACLEQTFKILDVYAMIKILCFYRSTPLHLHIVIDKKSETSVRTLFDTWTIPQVQVSIYHLNKLPKKFRWVVNERVPSDLGKLFYPLLVPKDVSNLLVIDSHLFCIGDVDTLWKIQYQGINQIQVLSNKGWGADIWLMDIYHLSASESYKNFINNVSNQKGRFANFTLTSTDLNIGETFIDTNHIRCNIVKNIENNNELTPIYNTILRFDGDVMPYLDYCPRIQKIEKIPPNSIKECKDVPETNVKYFKYRTLLNAKGFYYEPQKTDITLVTQMSLERTSAFELICQRWPGPISVTVYLRDDELVSALRFFIELKNFNNVSYHFVFKNGMYVPVNKLRNIALDYARSPYVFLNDVDFIPGSNVYTDVVEQIKNMTSMKKKALVIPAFEAANKNVIIPTNLKNASKLWGKSKIVPFQQKIFPRAHNATNYQKLKKATKPYSVKWTSFYQPYIVVEKSVPKYDERFVGYAGNKAEHLLEVNAAGYEFIVLPKTFLVHKYHQHSTDYYLFWNRTKYFNCSIAIEHKFYDEINKKYGTKLNVRQFNM